MVYVLCMNETILYTCELNKNNLDLSCPLSIYQQFVLFLAYSDLSLFADDTTLLHLDSNQTLVH
jgi:hypothetical protein